MAEEGSPRQQARRRFAVTMVLAAASIALTAAPALAAAPEVNHFRDVGTDVDPDFCGTGISIDVAFDVRGTEWFAPHNALYRNVVSGRVTLTNPLTGDVVINRFSGPFVQQLVSGDPEGVHVVDSSSIGLPELIKTPHGGVLIRDAGYITFRDTLDGEELLSSEIVVNKGPHPEADSDFELFCEVTTEALGI